MNASNVSQLGELLARLESLRSERRKGYWRVFLVALCYGLIAFTQGRQFILTYLGVLVVVFMLHDVGIRRVERQIDSVVDAIRELETARKEEAL